MAYEPIALVIRQALKPYGGIRVGQYEVIVERTGEMLGTARLVFCINAVAQGKWPPDGKGQKSSP